MLNIVIENSLKTRENKLITYKNAVIPWSPHEASPLCITNEDLLLNQWRKQEFLEKLYFVLVLINAIQPPI